MPNNKRIAWLWCTVLVLFVFVTASTVAIVGRLNLFLLDDSGAIPLMPENPTVYLEAAAAHTTFETPLLTPQLKAELVPAASASGKTKFGYEASDEKTTWSTMTPVDIFSMTYANDQQVITVKSDDTDKLIAPGTEQSYTFKLKNTGETNIDYVVNVDAYVTPGDYILPVEARVNRYDGKWIVGNGNSYVDVSTLDTAEDSGLLGPGKYTYYTLDWRWPFESGNDEYDTYLGNMAVEEDITLTIIISTTAVADELPDDGGDGDDPSDPSGPIDPNDPYDPSDPDSPNKPGKPSKPNDGITPPNTGDISQLGLWMMLAIASSSLMIALIVYLLKKKPLTEANTLEK